MPCPLLNHSSFHASNNCKDDTQTSSSVIYSRNVLPADVVPEHYMLELKPCLDSFTFEGFVEISIKILHTTKEIRLNAKELKINSGMLVIDGERY